MRLTRVQRVTPCLSSLRGSYQVLIHKQEYHVLSGTYVPCSTTWSLSEQLQQAQFITLAWAGYRIMDHLLPIDSPLHNSRKIMIAFSCSVLVEGATLPGILPYLCHITFTEANDPARLCPWPPSEWTWLLGQDEIKGTGSGLGSVVAPPNSECALFTLLFSLQTLNHPLSKNQLQAHSYSSSGAAPPTPLSCLCPWYTSRTPDTWLGSLDSEPSIFTSIAASLVSVTRCLLPVALVNSFPDVYSTYNWS